MRPRCILTSLFTLFVCLSETNGEIIYNLESPQAQWLKNKKQQETDQRAKNSLKSPASSGSPSVPPGGNAAPLASAVQTNDKTVGKSPSTTAGLSQAAPLPRRPATKPIPPVEAPKPKAEPPKPVAAKPNVQPKTIAKHAAPGIKTKAGPSRGPSRAASAQKAPAKETTTATKPEKTSAPKEAPPSPTQPPTPASVGGASPAVPAAPPVAVAGGSPAVPATPPVAVAGASPAAPAAPLAKQVPVPSGAAPQLNTNQAQTPQRFPQNAQPFQTGAGSGSNSTPRQTLGAETQQQPSRRGYSSEPAPMKRTLPRQPKATPVKRLRQKAGFTTTPSRRKNEQNRYAVRRNTGPVEKIRETGRITKPLQRGADTKLQPPMPLPTTLRQAAPNAGLPANTQFQQRSMRQSSSPRPAQPSPARAPHYRSPSTVIRHVPPRYAVRHQLGPITIAKGAEGHIAAAEESHAVAAAETWKEIGEQKALRDLESQAISCPIRRRSPNRA